MLNIGGISNITALLPMSGELIGFDCGPGENHMTITWLSQGDHMTIVIQGMF